MSPETPVCLEPLCPQSHHKSWSHCVPKATTCPGAAGGPQSPPMSPPHWVSPKPHRVLKFLGVPRASHGPEVIVTPKGPPMSPNSPCPQTHCVPKPTVSPNPRCPPPPALGVSAPSRVVLTPLFEALSLFFWHLPHLSAPHTPFFGLPTPSRLIFGVTAPSPGPACPPCPPGVLRWPNTARDKPQLVPGARGTTGYPLTPSPPLPLPVPQFPLGG